jgi:hypothetical protein
MTRTKAILQFTEEALWLYIAEAAVILILISIVSIHI